MKTEEGLIAFIKSKEGRIAIQVLRIEILKEM